ncbi:MAG: CHAP domain-containing protein [Solobacterium sp.]|nr:CHAP domain-containing protein [Solobacterium sp.]
MRKHNWKHRFYRLSLCALAAVFLSSFGDLQTTAFSESSLPLYVLHAGHTDVTSQLKDVFMTLHPEVSEEDMQRASLDIISSLPQSRGLQDVRFNVTLHDSENITLAAVEHVHVMINLVRDPTPTIRLKSDHVIVNLHDAFNPGACIASLSSPSGRLPNLRVEGDVDTETEGDYLVTYTASDLSSGTDTAQLLVTVKEHEEIIRAREEEERRKREEEERRQREEEERRREEERRKEEERKRLLIEQQAAVYGGRFPQNSGYNPYYGGYSNCTWTAWELARQYSGLCLPQWGSASSWYGNAAAAGYPVGTSPSPYCIAVYNGHVALVTGVSADGSSVYIKEGGFLGGYNERWVSAWGTGTRGLIGYIYLH